MKPEEAALLLRLHNQWRRGGESVPQMLDQKILGEAIDVAISAIADRSDLMSSVKNLIDMKGRHNTEIAYRKLVEAYEALKQK